MTMSDATAKCRRRHQGLWDAHTTTTCKVHDQEQGKGIEDEPASSPRVLLPFTMGLDPFEQMTVVTVAAKHFRAAIGEGALG